MSIVRVLLVGTPTFTTELAPLIERGGHMVQAHGSLDFLAHSSDGQELDLVVEVETSDVALKQRVLRALPGAIPILACALNASTTLAASWVEEPERVVGFGVLPPLAANGLVELARGLRTSDAAWHAAEAFWLSAGQTVKAVADGPGLVRARVVCCLINEAASALHEGAATAADIDKAMRLGTSYPRGPLAWGDALGLDTVLGVMQALQDEWGEDRYRPSPLLRRMVAAGFLGAKTGRGFFQAAAPPL